ncbi:efflux RND transporter periplasmic adaptor subunit [uncultured Cohaesibacter sp.]|uniref:efflux RND transporter periplasmic adaptor subunit n=1 Tax=uncultured Cohaesibacter sp. TaxID=1002546 RepID=UPI0029C97EBA|nr:efflux RND transporter periplasmic adaptor subunit [uncultured Cohaesibacter sp.]
MTKHFMLIGLMAILLSGCNNSLFSSADANEGVVEDPNARPAKIATAQRVALSLPKAFPGVTKASKKAILSFRVDGQIEDFPVHAGENLKEGDLIARLDDEPYRNVVASQQAAYDLAKISLERTQKLFEKEHVAKSTLDSAQSTFTAAEAALKSAKDNVKYTELSAPFDGIVAQTYVERYQTVSAGTQIVQFLGTNDIDVEFNVPEKLFLRFNPKKLAVYPNLAIQFDSLPGKSYEASYKEIDTIPDSVTRSYAVTVTMPRPDDLTVFPGMSVTASIDLATLLSNSNDGGVLVPLESVFDQDGKRWVWKLDEQNEAHKTEVKVYGLQDGQLRISNGLSEGDRVIAIGVSYVTEGMKVRSFKKEGGL